MRIVTNITAVIIGASVGVMIGGYFALRNHVPKQPFEVEPLPQFESYREQRSLEGDDLHSGLDSEHAEIDKNLVPEVAHYEEWEGTTEAKAGNSEAGAGVL